MRANLVGMIQAGLPKHRNYCGGSRPLRRFQKITTNKSRNKDMTTPVRNFRVYTGFSKSTDDDLSNTTLDVSDALTSHAVFTTLPVSLTELGQELTAFNTLRVDARKGGTDRTRKKNAARQALIDSLIKIALYCQGVARHDLNTLLSSGFEVVSTNRTSVPLDQPAIIDVLNNVSGQLTLRGQSVLNARQYAVRGSTDGGTTWTDLGTFNGARLMVLSPVTPGTTYTLQFCAKGGSTSQSAWSDPVSRMAT